jgi:8-hydroxy-5-deazaflavin:NADPH oxidoreductase
MKIMKIGILGAGNVGTTLGKAWAIQGHRIIFGMRDPQSPIVQALLDETKGDVHAATIADTALVAEILALTVPWDSVPVVLDCTNPLVANKLHETAKLNISGGEQVAAWLPKARVVKIFNTVGWEIMAQPQVGNETSTMFYAGDDGEAKIVAAQLAREMGFDAIDVGGLSASNHLENLAGFWGQLVYGQEMGRTIGWRLLKR